MNRVVPLMIGFCLFAQSSEGQAGRVRHHSTSYDPSEIEWSKQRGSATLTGTATWTFRGHSVTCASGSVHLFPRSRYSDETMAKALGSMDRASVTLDKVAGFYDSDPRELRDARTTACDSRGAFQFSDLPAGEYYVFANIEVISRMHIVGGANSTDRHGIIHMQRIRLSDGEKIPVQFN